MIGNGGWASQNSRWIHFGLGDQTVVDSLIIYWPSGEIEKINSLNGDQKYKVREGEGVVTHIFSVPKKTAICSASSGVQWLS